MAEQQPTVIDFRDLRPKGREGREGDRREGPRRVEERMLHLAEQVLLSTACLVADRLVAAEVSDDETTDGMLALVKAVEAYRLCADRAFPTPAEEGRRATD